MTTNPVTAAPPPVPAASRTRVRGAFGAFTRLFAVQGAWNYETLMGNGIAFCAEPMLRHLPPERFRDAMARQARYFNAHPYLAGVAVGALARAELDGEAPERIDRFRTALCGPLGSVGDQLVWAAWLPVCSLIGLGVFALGGNALATVATFLIVYNIGHVLLRAWGLRVGLAQGMRVAPALASPILRRGPAVLARVAAILAGLVLPLALKHVIGPGRALAGAVAVVALFGAVLVARFSTRTPGWRAALAVLALFVLYSVIR